MATGPGKQVSFRRSWSERVRTRLVHWSFLFTRAMTLGVRGIVLNAEGEVLLVRHSYVRGWYFPGGGVEIGETFESALTRELAEEAHIEIQGPPRLHGLFFNVHISPRDHVAVYVISDFRQTGVRAPDLEILEARFFARDALPDDASPGTRRRLAEIFDGAPVSAHW
jgi:ADP-ribose pyrophosphatase YjhB (NUDIX family)